MMNNKIPVVLVFCLVAVSVSLAQPVVEHGVSDTSRSFTVDRLRIARKEGDTDSCIYPIRNCELGYGESKLSKKICHIETTRGRDLKECPEPLFDTFTLERTGDTQLSYSGLHLKSPYHKIPTSAKGNIFPLNSRMYFARFPLDDFKIILTKISG
eukprot:Nk52_evm1s1104 gene=Nk52_evmTU1s1104